MIQRGADFVCRMSGAAIDYTENDAVPGVLIDVEAYGDTLDVEAVLVFEMRPPCGDRALRLAEVESRVECEGALAVVNAEKFAADAVVCGGETGELVLVSLDVGDCICDYSDGWCEFPIACDEAIDAVAEFWGQLLESGQLWLWWWWWWCRVVSASIVRVCIVNELARDWHGHCHDARGTSTAHISCSMLTTCS